jgi:hypothetical protein
VKTNDASALRSARAYRPLPLLRLDEPLVFGSADKEITAKNAADGDWSVAIVLICALA